MNVSIAIVQVIGIIFAIAGLAMAVSSKETVASMEEAIQNKGTFFTWGLLALMVGAVVLGFNNAWIYGLPMIITILGWLALLKGAFIMVFPNAARSFYKKCVTKGTVVPIGIIVIIVGLFLLYI